MEEYLLKRRKSNPRSEGFIRKRKITAKVTLSAASRLLGKKFSSSSDLMNPCKLWMHTIPTQDCDVLFTFPPNTSDQTLMWLLACLRTRLPELGVHVRHHSTSGVYGFYLTASCEYLLKGAEELRLRKRLNPEFGGGLKEFLYDEQQCFAGIESPNTFLTSQERQFIVLHLLHGLRAVVGDELNDVKFVEGQAIVPKCISEGIISQILPLHDEVVIEDLRQNWVRAFFHPQPLNKICEYFGVKIAVYFAWLGHYTYALIIPAFFGLFLWLIFLGRHQIIDDVCFVVFALFNVLWATLYLESWKRYCAELTYRWGTIDTEDELLVEPRPLFRGVLKMSPVNGRLEPTYPAWKRSFFRYCVSLPVILLCLGVVLMSMLAILELQEWWDKWIDEYDYPFWLKYLPKILLALVINILDLIYQKIAVWLNDKENFRLQETYENHLISKLIMFQFVNSFLSLFYIAFYLQDMDRLKQQLATLLITRQVIGNIRESCIPFIMEQFNLARMSFEAFGAFNSSTGDEASSSKSSLHHPPEKVLPQSNENDDISLIKRLQSEKDERSEPTRHIRTLSSDRNLSQAEVESSMYKYDGTFEDYLEMFIQFGYVVLFSSAFPMAGMCALLNNIIEIRSDAFKLCCIFQRPFGQRVENIGSWQEAMEIMGVIAVIVNCALIGMSGQVHRMFPDLSITGTIILIIALEHITLTLKLAIAHAIPDIPDWVATEMAKIEFNRREAVKKLAKTNSGAAHVLRNTTPILPTQLENRLSRHACTQTEDAPVLDESLIAADSQPEQGFRLNLGKSRFRLGDKVKRGSKKKTVQRTGSPRHRPLSEGDSLSSTFKNLEELVTPVAVSNLVKCTKGFSNASEKIGSPIAELEQNAQTDLSNSDSVAAKDDMSDCDSKEENELQLLLPTETVDKRSNEAEPNIPESSTSTTPKAPQSKFGRFSPPSLKIKGFRRLSTGNQSGESSQSRTSNWSATAFQLFRKSLSLKSSHKTVPVVGSVSDAISESNLTEKETEPSSDEDISSK